MNQSLARNVWVLSAVLAFANCSAPIIVFVGSIVGGLIAPDESLATLPVALFVVGAATSAIPSALLMQRVGRKPIFLSGSAMAMVASILAALCIAEQWFWGYCAAVFLLGMTNAVVQQFRFAAMESVSSERVTQAASRVLLGGVVAAFLGPELALYFKDAASTAYSGSFYALAAMLLIALTGLWLGYQEVPPAVTASTETPRPMRIILQQPVLWTAMLAGIIAFAVMSLIMTATPISMHVVNGFSLEDTKWVIQSHIAAMFLPSLVTAWIFRRVGIVGMMLLGIGAYLITILIGVWDQHLIHYWFALVLLGIGWNFLFIGGTSLLPKSYSGSERFTMQALNDLCIYIAQATVSLLSGWLLLSIGWSLLLIICLPLIVIQILVIVYWKKTSKK